MSIQKSSIASSVLYCILSSSMSLVNKYTLTVFPFATTLVFFQYAFSFLAIGLSAAIGFFDMSSVDLMQVRKLIPVAFFFHLCIWTGSKVMLHGNVDTFIAFRSLVPGIIAVFDSYRTGIFPRSAEIFSLLLVAISGSCFALVDDKFNTQAYTWGLTFICTVTVESILIKHTFDSTNVSPWQMSFYLNIFGSLFALSFILLSSDGVEYSEIWTYFTTLQSSSFAVLFSCVTGFLTSLANSFARKTLEAASFSMLGVANKFITIGLNVFVWKHHSSLPATIQLIIAVSGTVLYSHATSMWKNTKMDKWFKVMISIMLFVSVVVLFVSRLPSESSKKFSAVGEHVNISTHKCLGHGYSSRSCVFRDIDYDLQGKEFKYYNPKKSQIIAFQEHYALHEFPDKFVTLKSMVHRKTLHWTIRKMFEDLPVQRKRRCIIHDEVLLWQAMQPVNVGHVILDDLFASFKVTENLGLSKNAKLQVILMEDGCTNKVCERLQELWHPSISYKPVVHFQDFLHTYSDCSRIRFKELYVGGAGGSSMHGNLQYSERYARKTDGYPIGMAFTAKIFDDFRAQVLRKNEIDSYSDTKTQILLYNKTRAGPSGEKILTDRSITNLHEISEALKKRLPSYEIKVRDPSTYQNFADELRDIARTKVLVTPPGGVMFAALFLPVGSTLLGIDACLGPKFEDCGNQEINRLFSFLNIKSLRYTPKLVQKDFSSFERMYEVYKRNMRLDLNRLVDLLEEEALQ